MQNNQESFRELHLRADKVMLFLVGLHWFFAAFISPIANGTYLIGLIGGGLLAVLTYAAYILFKGERYFRILVAIVLMLFSSIYIQQHLGRIEFHFHIFVAISFLTIYKDYLPTIVAGITTALYHILFNIFQEHSVTIFGQPLYLFNYGCGWDIVFLHIFFALCEVVIISIFISRSTKQFVNVLNMQNSYLELNRSLESEVSKQTVDLRKINELYKESQSITHLGNWEWDMLSRKVTWDDQVYRIFDLEPQSIEATYDTFMNYVHPEDRVAVQESVDAAISLQKVYDITHRFLLLNNKVKHVRERGKVYTDSDNLPVRMVGSMQEVTEEMEVHNRLQESEKKFRLMSENTSTGIFIYRDVFLYVNHAMEEIMGYSDEEFSHVNPLSLLSADEREDAAYNLQRRKRGEEFSQEYPAVTVMTKSGKEKIVSIYTTTIAYDGGFAGLGTLIDITDAKKAEDELKTLSQVVEQTDDIVKITKANGTITYVNDAFVAHTGFTRREIIGKKANVLKSGEHQSEFYTDMWNTILAGDIYRAILINRKKDGTLFHEEQTITPIINDKGDITSFVSTGKDISERIDLENKLIEMATKDKLTNTYNRHKFDEMLNEELKRYQRSKTPFSLIMLDIDYFKKINDTFGHDIGDAILVEFSQLIEQSIRKIDKLSRWGGEEFMILCLDTSEEASMLLAEKLHVILEHHSFEKVNKVTASFGVTTLNKDDTLELLLKRVDNALYQAKENGRNCIVKL